MTKIEKIKSGTIKDYLGPGIVGGFLFGLITFIIFSIGKSWEKGIFIGIFFWLIMFLIHFGGFLYTEWWQRKKKLNILQSNEYLELISKRYNLTNDLYYEKEIEHFHTEIYREESEEINHYLKIYCDYRIESFEQLVNDVSNLNYITSVFWEYGFITIKISTIENSFYYLTENVLQQLEKYNVKPLSKIEWEQTFEKDIKGLEKEELSKRTKTLKLGKLKITIIKKK